MLLNVSEFLEYCREVAKNGKGCIALDFETTGTNPRKDQAFLIGLSSKQFGEASFFLNEIDRHDASLCLQLLCGNEKLRYAAHNAKFEMGFLRYQYGVEIKGLVWDTEVFAMTADNSHTKKQGGTGYSLQACAVRMGMTKYKPMLEWLEANGPLYHKAPRDFIVPYVEQDAKISRLACEQQLEVFQDWNNSLVPITPVIKLECQTTKNLFAIEDAGIRVDTDYCMEALVYEEKRAERISALFEDLHGQRFVDSAKCLAPILVMAGCVLGKSDGGAPSVAYESLAPHKDLPVVQKILQIRDAIKRKGTYWENFLRLHEDGVIHPSVRQTGAASFRMSIVDPAAQTWPDDFEDPDCKYPVRRAFTALNEDCIIVSADYDQMELRKICDEAGDSLMIEAFERGTDFHQETANAAGVKRGLAKQGRFAKLYGSGIPGLSKTLGVSIELTTAISRAIDESCPGVTAYNRQLIKEAKILKWGHNWLGRRFKFQAGFEYKYPNYRIQGGCSEILRIAVEDVSRFLEKHAHPMTKIILLIHDEIVFNFHKNDLHLIPEVKRLMINAQRDKKRLAMDVSVATGPNFFDLKESTDGKTA